MQMTAERLIKRLMNVPPETPILILVGSAANRTQAPVGLPTVKVVNGETISVTLHRRKGRPAAVLS